MITGRRWVVRDRYGYDVYLTNERWDHILEFHSEMAHFEDELQITLKRGRRRQDTLDTSVYTYFYPFFYLPNGHTHIVAIVKSTHGEIATNSFVMTAYQKTIYSQR